MSSTFNPATEYFALRDMTSFKGRFRAFFALLNPRLLLATEEESRGAFERMKKLSSSWEGSGKRRTFESLQAEDRWAAKLAAASYHPESKTIISKPFRMAGLVCGAIPISWFAVARSTTSDKRRTILALCMIQAHSGAFNYYNRSGPDATPVLQLGLCFFAAITVGVSVALGSHRWIRANASRPKWLLLFVPSLGACAATTFNNLMMRSAELQQGIPVFDPDSGQQLGTSKQASFQAYASILMTRYTLILFSLVLPQVASMAATQWKLAPSRVMLCRNLTVAVGFPVGFSVSQALMPLHMRGRVNDVVEKDMTCCLPSPEMGHEGPARGVSVPSRVVVFSRGK
jgi:hypothetical protein